MGEIGRTTGISTESANDSVFLYNKYAYYLILVDPNFSHFVDTTMKNYAYLCPSHNSTLSTRST